MHWLGDECSTFSRSARACCESFHFYNQIMPHNNNIQIRMCCQCYKESSVVPEHAPTVTPEILFSSHVAALRNLLEGGIINDHWLVA